MLRLRRLMKDELFLLNILKEASLWKAMFKIYQQEGTMSSTKLYSFNDTNLCYCKILCQGYHFEVR